MAKKTSPSSALLIWIGYLIFLFVLAEMMSWIALAQLEGRFTGYREIFSELQGVASAPTGLQDLTSGASLAKNREIINPYVGYTYPTYMRKNVRTHGQERLEDYGWKDGAGPLMRERSPDTVIINIIGGSVAREFVDEGGTGVLAAELQKSPAFKDKKIVFSSTAFYGHKEPQQLLAVNYMMTLGAKFDILIALDGFNEIALGKVDNEPDGVSVFYPFWWYDRLAEFSPDPDLNVAKGEIVYLRKKRADAAASHLHSLSRFSMTANFLWKIADRRADSELGRKALDLHSHVSLSGSGTVRIDRGPAPTYDSVSAYLADQVSVWSNATTALANIAKTNDMRFFSFLQPNQYADHHVMDAYERHKGWSDTQPFKPLVEQGYPMLKAAGQKLAAEKGISFHDFSEIFNDYEGHVYNDNCCHFSEPEPNAYLAKKIAEVLLKEIK